MTDNDFVVDEIKLRGLIDSLSAYIESYHGGGVEYVKYEDDKLQIRLTGACEGCPLSAVTVKGWVEGTVKQFFPAILEVSAVE